MLTMICKISLWSLHMIGLDLWCLMPLSTIFQLYRGCQFSLWMKPEYMEKSIDLSHLTVTDKLDHIMFYRLNLIRNGVVESGIKHHKSKPIMCKDQREILQIIVNIFYDIITLQKCIPIIFLWYYFLNGLFL
jgi:hypothetical protein